MAIRKVKAGNGESRYEVRVYENGRGSKEIRKRFKRKVDAEKYEADFGRERDKLLGNSIYAGATLTRLFSDEAEHWFQVAKLSMTIGSQIRAQGILKEFGERIGGMQLQRITPEFLGSLQDELLAKGFSRATVIRKINVILSVLNHSVRLRRVPFNPSSGFRRMRPESPEMKFWNEDEAQSFLAAMSVRYPEGSSERWVYVAYLTALNTALRAGEIWGLKEIDLQIAKGTIIVRRQLNRVSRAFAETKGRKSRVVPCNVDLMTEMQALVRQNRMSASECIFQTARHVSIDHDNFLSRVFDKDLKSWGGRPIRFHDLRHTATTLMLANGVDIRTVKEICGHASMETTMRYIHLLNGSVEKVSAAFSISVKGVSRMS